MSILINTIRNWVKRRFYLFDIDDLQVGGHCGICGKWVDSVITEKGWGVCLCKYCSVGDKNHD